MEARVSDPVRPAKYPPLPAFDETKFYSIQLFRPATHAGRTLTPAGKQVVRGDVATEIQASIYTAKETAAP